MTAILPAAALLAGALVQGVSGFAFSLLSLPLLCLVMPAREVVPMLTLFGLVLNAIVLASSRSHARPGRFLPLLMAGAAGTLPGVLLLGTVPDGPLRAAVGLVVLSTAILYLAGVRVRLSNERAAMIPVGLLSGLLNGLMTFSGPPVIILLANQGAERDEFRANLSMYFLGLNVVTIPMLVAGGLLTGEILRRSAGLLPFVALGAGAGALLSRRIPQAHFRRGVLILLGLLGIASVLNAV